MQYWVNEQGCNLYVVDVTKMVGSVYYRKRMKHDRYVVSTDFALPELRMMLTFDCMAGVRFWMRRFGFKEIKRSSIL